MLRSLTPIAVLALILRLVLFVQLDGDPRYDRPDSDQAIYHSWAAAWAQGEVYPPEPADQPFWRSPGYALVLSLVYRVAGSEAPSGPRAMVALQMLFGAAATVALAAFALRRRGRAEAWLAAALMSLHGPVLFMETLLLPVGLAVPLFTFGGLALLELLERERPAAWPLARAGLLGGCTAILRPNLALALPVAAWLLWRRKHGIGAAGRYLLFAALPLLVTTGWNLARSGELVITGANGPFNLYFAYGPDAGPTFATHDVKWGNPNQRGLAVDVMSIETDTPKEEISTRAASRYWGDKAEDWIADHHAGTLRLAAEKLLGVFTWRDLAVVAPMSGSRSAFWLPRFLLLPFPLLVLLACTGAWRRRGAASAALLYGLLPIVTGAVVFFTYTRFRAPAVPLLALAGAAGAIELVRCKWTPLRTAALVAGALALALASNPWLGRKPAELKPWVASQAQGWWLSGEAWKRRYLTGKEAGAPETNLLELAESAYETAIRINPGQPWPHMALAAILRDEHDDARAAWRAYRRVTQDFPDFGPGFLELGRCELRGHNAAGEPDPARADEHFQRALALRQMFTDFLPDWAEALYRLGRKDEAVAKLRLALEMGVWPPQKRALLEATYLGWTGKRFSKEQDAGQ